MEINLNSITGQKEICPSERSRKDIKSLDAGRKNRMKESKLDCDGSYPVQPRVAVGAIVFKDNRVLLVRRGKPPAENLWAIPGGRVEIGETLQQAAEREIFEETGITIRALEPAYTFDVIDRDAIGQTRYHYVIVDLTADYIAGEPRAGDDASAARWISSGELALLKVSSKTRRLLKSQFKFGD
jgi:ADP-ribose pyrophosphatase